MLCEADLLRSTRSSHDIELRLEFLSARGNLCERSLSACGLRSLLAQGRHGGSGHTGPLFGIVPLRRVIFIVELGGRGDIRLLQSAILLLLLDLGVIVGGIIFSGQLREHLGGISH